MASLLHNADPKILEQNPEIVAIPYALQLEYQLLGCIVGDNSLLDHLPFLMVDHFEAPEHQRIYAAMRDMRFDGVLITPFSIAQKITDFPEITTYIARAHSASMGMLRPMEEAKYLVEVSQRRDIIALCQKQIEALKQTDKPASEHATVLMTSLEKISAKNTGMRFQNDAQVTRDILNKLQNPRPAISTGLATLDTAMEGGLQPGMCYALLGRKKMGKSALAGTISCNLNQAKVKHLYIACEMGTEQIQQRNLARLTRSFSSAFRNSYGQSKAFQEKIIEQEQLSQRHIIYLNAPGITFDDLRRSVAQAVTIHKIRGFVLDSLQLVGGVPKGKSKVDHYDDVAQWVADYCRMHGLFSIVTGQINQTGNVRFGEGIRLSCDQAYEIRAPKEDVSRSDRWLEMLETRYTAWMNVGSENSPRLLLDQHGPYFFDNGSPDIDDLGFGE